MTKPNNPFRYFDSSPEVIRLVVMMYVRYPLSLRTSRTCWRSVASTSATRRCGCGGNRFGPMFAAEIRKKRVDAMRV